jgi:iron complex transport system ATP-binding protein
MSAIALQDVSVALGGTEAVHRVSTTVAQGEWVGLIGPNGAGKTTVLRAVAGLVAFTGEIDLDGCALKTSSRRQIARRIALVPQKPETPAALTVAEYVLLGRTPHIGYLATESRADEQAAAAALERLALTEFADRPLDSLSGGELQRVVIARAIAQQASILLLDEPTSALDLGHQQQVLELVDELRQGGDLTVVAAMHDLTLAAQYADRLLLLDHGQVVSDGDAADVLTKQSIESLYGATVRVINEDGRLFVLPERER